MKTRVSFRIKASCLRVLNKNNINISFVSPGLQTLGANKTGFYLKIFHFDIREMLPIIRCDR